MKKALPVLLILALLLSFPVSAAAGKLTAPAVDGQVGSQVSVDLQLENPGVVAMLIAVRYDPAVLRLDGVKNGSIFTDSNAQFGNDLTANPFKLVFIDALRKDNITTSGTLCTLQFTILKATASGETAVRFSVDKSSTFDVNLNEVTVADTSCAVRMPAAAGSETTAKPAASTPSAGTTPPTTAAAKPTTTAATKPAATSAAKPTITAASQSPSVTAKTTAAASTASAATAAASGTPAESTAAGTPAASASAVADPAAETVPDTKASSDDGDAEKSLPDASETDAAEVYADGAVTESLSEAETAVLLDAPQEKTSRTLVWVLIPIIVIAAVVIILLARKKKSADPV